MEAIQFAKQFDFDQAEEKLKAANESLTLAHNAQTDMLIAEAQGEEKYYYIVNGA